MKLLIEILSVIAAFLAIFSFIFGIRDLKGLRRTLTNRTRKNRITRSSPAKPKEEPHSEDNPGSAAGKIVLISGALYSLLEIATISEYFPRGLIYNFVFLILILICTFFSLRSVSTIKSLILIMYFWIVIEILYLLTEHSPAIDHRTFEALIDPWLYPIKFPYFHASLVFLSAILVYIFSNRK